MSTIIKQLLGNKSYCALPFVHQYKNLDGLEYLCCYSSSSKINAINYQELTDIREKILKGILVKQC